MTLPQQLINTFWFAHGVIALLTNIIITAPLFLLGMSLPHAWGMGLMFTLGCYVGRERKVAEINAGSRSIMPWDWRHNPQVYQDVGVPALVCGVPLIAICLWIF